MRQNGYYWVKIRQHWSVAEFINDVGWFVTGLMDRIYDDQFAAINEQRILPPDESQVNKEI